MWTLIVVMTTLLPPQGITKHGFETKEDCLSYATLWCWPPDLPRSQRPFICKCEWGIAP